MAFGRSNRGVAAELDLSVKAVEKAVTRVVRKLGLNDEPLLDSRLSASLVYLRAQGGPVAVSKRHRWNHDRRQARRREAGRQKGSAASPGTDHPSRTPPGRPAGDQSIRSPVPTLIHDRPDGVTPSVVAPTPSLPRWWAPSL